MSFESIPPLWYGPAETGGSNNWGGNANSGTFQRCQITAKFVDNSGTLRVLIARVILDYFMDFCGGSIVRSPQVIICNPDQWGRSEFFFDAGVSGESHLTWTALRNGEFPMIDLNFILGQDRIQVRDATKWGWQQLALALPQYALWTGKRMMHANGPDGSNMEELLDHLQALNGTPILRQSLYANGTIGGDGHDAYCRTTAGDRQLVEWEVDIHASPPFNNYNSGNDCLSWTIIFNWGQDDGECNCRDCVMERMEDYGGDAMMRGALYDHISRVYASPLHSRVLTRTLWRNG